MFFFQGKKRALVFKVVSLSIFILIYWLFFYELNNFCKWGKYKNNVYIIILCLILILAWFIFEIIMIFKNIGYKNRAFNSFKLIANIIFAVAILAITCFYCFQIYEGVKSYEGKLAIFLHNVQDKKTVKLIHNNIYTYGINGIFEDIQSKIEMPQKLYMATNFSLAFDSNGNIKSFDTFLYGKNSDGKLQTFLISYDSEKSDNITIILNGYVKSTYNNDKLFEPLLDTMKVISLKNTVSKWKSKTFGILYYGKKSFGYNTSGIIYINSKGKTNTPNFSYSEIVGYAVSVYVPGMENSILPYRFILTDNLNTNLNMTNSTNKNNTDNNYSSDNQFYLTKQLGYRLEVTAAALGSRSYSKVGQGADGDYNGNSKALYQSRDNGVSWEYEKEIKK